MRSLTMSLLALSLASCSPSYNNPGVKSSPDPLLESGCTAVDYSHSQGCIVEIPEEASPSRSDSLPSYRATIDDIIPSASAPPASSRPQVDIYFEINCGHCTTYKEMLAEQKVQEKFPGFDFNLICVELPWFGEPGRCRERYGNDGKAEYDGLTQRLGKEASTPTTFVNGQALQDPWELVRVLEKF